MVQQLEPGKENLSLSIWVGCKGNEDFMSEISAIANTTPTPNTVDDDQVFDLLLQDPETALRAFRVARLVETIATKACGSISRGGDFLTALADGADCSWEPNSKAVMVASRIRRQIAQLMSCCGCDPNALLRAMTRDGRLCPGPPAADPSAISSDEIALMPA